MNLTQNEKRISYHESIIFSQGRIISPVKCEYLKIIAFYCLLVYILSLLFNSMIIGFFLKNKKHINPLNLLIIALAVLNVFATLGEIPLVIVSNFQCRFKF